MRHASGAPLELLTHVVGTFTSQMPPMFAEFVDMIATGSYGSANLRLASGAENLRAINEFGKTSGVNTDLFESALRTLNASEAASHGTNIAAVFESVKKQRG